jgi:hypothetical protein
MMNHMSAPTHVSDCEAQRQALVAEMNAETGDDWRNANKPGSFGCHELLDRTAMLSSLLEQFVLSHPACVQNPEWYALADQAASALSELYQRVGSQHLSAPPAAAE